MAISLKRRSEARPKPDSMTLVEHLTELRSRVLVCAVAFVVTATVAFLFYPWILSFLKHPYCQVAPHRCGFYITGPLDGLALRVKIAAYGGLVLASPVLLWEFWRFITPGLHPQGEEVRHPLHRGVHRPVRPGLPGGVRHLPPRAHFLDSEHRRSQPHRRSSTPPSTSASSC